MNLRNGMILDLRTNTKPPKDLKEWNENNGEEDDNFYHE